MSYEFRYVVRLLFIYVGISSWFSFVSSLFISLVTSIVCYEVGSFVLSFVRYFDRSVFIPSVCSFVISLCIDCSFSLLLISLCSYVCIYLSGFIHVFLSCGMSCVMHVFHYCCRLGFFRYVCVRYYLIYFGGYFVLSLFLYLFSLCVRSLCLYFLSSSVSPWLLMYCLCLCFLSECVSLFLPVVIYLCSDLFMSVGSSFFLKLFH